ncbi:MAG: DUF4373 domain-containing protein [Bacteroidales bacterium]
MAKDTFWFPHDCNAADDDKTMILIDQLGLEGYGIYWVLIEKLREREDFKMPFNTIPIMARRYGTTSEKMKTVVTQFGLFEYDEDGFFFSQSLVNRMQKWIDKKEKLSIAGKISAQKRLKNSTNAQQMLNKCSTNVEQMPNKCLTIIEDNRIEYDITEDNIEDSENRSNKVYLQSSEGEIYFPNANKKKDTIVSKESDLDDLNSKAEELYKMYPSKCPKRNTSLGKSSNDKKKLVKLMKCKDTPYEMIKFTIQAEIDEKHGKQYMSNFSTFLNNLPDYGYQESNVKEQEKQPAKNEVVFNGKVYR